ncbi:MAG: Hsp20/alpha crystallin family protein [Bacillota bacterium]
MSVTRWDPFNDLYQLQRVVNRMVGDVLPVRRESVAEAGDFFAPVDVYETEDGFEVQVELPGMKIEDIDISVTGQDIVIKGERKAEENVKDRQCLRSERRFGQFYRAFTLGVPIDSTKVKATYRNGVLTVFVPKAEETKPRQVKIDLQ